MDKLTFLQLLKSGRQQWEALLAPVDERQTAQPRIAGDTSIKDLIAHITWYEREMVNLLQSRILAGSELWNLPTDERNAAIYEINRDRSLSDIQSEAARVYQQLLAAAESLSDDELNNPSNFGDMPADWIPWKLIAGNAYEHYQQHTSDLQAWID
jgi:hypothetical protein